MLRKKIDESRRKRELKKIGKKLLALIRLNDEESRIAALKMIDEHQHDPEVINYQQRGQATPLMLACELKKNNIVKRLLATQCVDVNAKGHDGTHALETAIKSRNDKIALLLASDQRVLINEAGKDGVPSIYLALNAEDIKYSKDCPLEIAQAMLSRTDIELASQYIREGRHGRDGASKRLYQYECKTLLHVLIAALGIYHERSEGPTAYHNSYHQKFEVTRQLFKAVLAAGKVDINAFAVDVLNAKKTMKTALMLAVQANLPEVVEMLLAAGANVTLRDEGGHSASQLAKLIAAKGGYGARNAKRMAGMIKQSKLKESVTSTPATLFAPQPVPAEYLAPPQPSAPPAEEMFAAHKI